MAPYTTLAGPPELIRDRFVVANNFENEAAAAAASTTMRPPNLIPIYGNPCLDLFFKVVKPSEYKDFSVREKKISEIKAEVEASCTYLKQILPLAWSHNPITTLKLIFNLLDEKHFHQAFHTAAVWLHHNHPKTLLCNVSNIELFHCLFIPVEILYRLLEDGDQHRRMEPLAKMINKAVERYEHDPDYHLLYDQVMDLFVEHLKSDIQILKRKWKQSDDINYDYDDAQVSDAAYCCLFRSSQDVHILRSVLLWETIARKVFPRESYPEYQDLEEADYMRKIRDRLRKEVLVPLDKAERSQCSNRPRKAGAVETYLKEVKADKCKIEADALLPRDILAFADDPNLQKVAELQWKTMVEDMQRQGKNGKKTLSNCLAVYDDNSEFHSGHGIRMDASVALTLLMSELNEEPWKGKVINFSESPQLHFIQGNNLMNKCEFVSNMQKDQNLDFQKVFDLILEVAVNGNLKPEQMINKVFVLTEYKHFEDVSNNSWKTDYEAIQSKFKDKGYGTAVPHIVFWRLDSWGHESRPVMPSKEPGVTLLSGLSSNLIKLFLENGGEIGPDQFMESAISSKKFQKLVVVD
ncbi:uncharacterized protein Pyn_22038 [Prunus yedoensis var. nudiflora]|uniref:Uncharacterized protein n=1 Tax=Prunus yedoensis var. nudiflora TaxID=2094558 RepID=A0A314UVG4_PRUYE|nr:uncharacterized protein Pyn_22038 [Prunus yedoensis var. nudiflora]